MLDILSRICQSNKLVTHDFKTNLNRVNSKIVVPSEDNIYQEYYFILECEFADDSFIEKLADELAEKLMDNLETLECTDESFRKNCTLILCCEAGCISDLSLLKFEENPYFFKKNVITYSKDELTALKKALNNQFSNEHLNRLLMADGGDLFESFKTLSLEDGNYYPLLIRIITKLPFVHYLPQSNQLNDLDSFVKKVLKSSDLKLLDFICDGDGKLSDELIDTKISSSWGEL